MDHLGLDLGTTTISAAVLDADGRLLCTRTVPGGAAVAGQPWERKQDAFLRNPADDALAVAV